MAPVRENMENETLAQAFVRYVHEDLQQIKQPHFDIAFRLHEAYTQCYHLELGYKDVYELAEIEFGFKRSTTAAYIGVSRAYVGSDKQPVKPWSEFSFSQLVEMLPMDSYDRTKITPDMTIKQSREWRRDHKFVTLESGDRVLYGELSDKQRRAYEDFKSKQKEEGNSVQTSGQDDHSFMEHDVLMLSVHLEKAYRNSLTPSGRVDFANFARYLLDNGVVKL